MVPPMALARTAVAVIALGATAMLSPKAGPARQAGGEDAGAAADASVQGPPLQGAQLEAAVEALLGLGRRAGPEAWRRLGPAAVPPLEKIARGAPAPERREAAMRSLGALEGIPEAAASLRQIASDPRAADEDRCRAAFALAQQQGPAAVADLEPLLQDPRESLRIGAARGLGQAGGDDAKKALEDRLEQEETPVVREAIQRTLTLMQP
jgi:HEAT repeat protein